MNSILTKKTAKLSYKASEQPHQELLVNIYHI